MNKLLLTTAIVAASAFTATAQTAATDGMFRTKADPMEIHASTFIGKRVYASEAAFDAIEFQGVQEGWQDIGEINDVVLSRDGAVEAVLVDIGGFLGMGEHRVAVDMDAIRFVSDSATPDSEGDFFLVMNASRANLESAPPYAWIEDTRLDTDASTAGTADADMATDATAGAAMTREPIVRDGFVTAEPEVLTADKLTGAAVYDVNDRRIGEVSDLLLADDGKVTATVVDVGGFLGMGEKPVSLDLSQIDILRNDAGDDVRVYVSMTKEALEAMPAYVN